MLIRVISACWKLYQLSNNDVTEMHCFKVKEIRGRMESGKELR